jgi:hypothetical protein
MKLKNQTRDRYLLAALIDLRLVHRDREHERK